MCYKNIVCKSLYTYVKSALGKFFLSPKPTLIQFVWLRANRTHHNNVWILNLRSDWSAATEAGRYQRPVSSYADFLFV